MSDYVIECVESAIEKAKENQYDSFVDYVTAVEDLVEDVLGYEYRQMACEFCYT